MKQYWVKLTWLLGFVGSGRKPIKDSSSKLSVVINLLIFRLCKFYHQSSIARTCAKSEWNSTLDRVVLTLIIIYEILLLHAKHLTEFYITYHHSPVKMGSVLKLPHCDFPDKIQYILSIIVERDPGQAWCVNDWKKWATTIIIDQVYDSLPPKLPLQTFLVERLWILECGILGRPCR